MEGQDKTVCISDLIPSKVNDLSKPLLVNRLKVQTTPRPAPEALAPAK